MWLVVGLGNPGRQYQSNRHNVGFQVVDELHRRAESSPFRAKLGAEVAEASLGGQRILLCKPMEFMNVSGDSVARVGRFWKIEPADTVVVHDDMDLTFGRLKLGQGGGHGGHNGLRSIIEQLGTAGFVRVRVGVGRPPAGWEPAGYVLADFTADESRQLGDLQGSAADSVEEIVKRGLQAAMNRFNSNRNQGGPA